MNNDCNVQIKRKGGRLYETTRTKEENIEAAIGHMFIDEQPFLAIYAEAQKPHKILVLKVMY